MKNLNDAFLKYNDEKRIRSVTYNEMKTKIDTIVGEIRKNEEVRSFSTLYLGSYATKTGVEYKDKDYDIDVGIRLNIRESDVHKTSAKIEKDSIYSAIKDYRERKYKTMCVSARYFKDEKPLYHIDFPIYAYDDDNKTYFIAKGTDDVKWEKCEPHKLIEYLKYNDQSGFEVESYRRTIRYLKLWKNKVFSTEKKYSCPPSIAINLTTRKAFDDVMNQNEIDNIVEVVNRLIDQINYEVTLTLPYEPYSNIFEKMNTNSDNVKIYYTKLKELKHALDSAKNMETKSLEESCKILRKVFPDFPLPDKEDVAESFAPTGSYGG